MSLKIKIDNSGTYSEDTSKFFGQAFVPEKWLKDGEFAPTEIFFCQIDLEEIQKIEKTDLLAEKGYLYFFFDFEEKIAKGIVRYAESPDASVFFNEEAETDYDVETEYKIKFERAEKIENGLLSKEKKLVGDEVCLLKFTPDSFEEIDFLSGVEGSVCFVIEKGDLIKKRFEKAYLINIT